MADPWADLCREVAHHWSPQRFLPVTTLVAVSGGGDSVALLRILHAMYGRGQLPMQPSNQTASEVPSALSPLAPDDDPAPVDDALEQGATEDAQSAALAPGKLVVAHWNHRLRGVESDQDAEWVEQLCASLGVPCRIGHCPASGAPSEVSEAQLRDQRYAFLLETAHRIGARYVATGHTADDVVETVLHHLLRGSGPAGLAGIPRFRPLGSDVVLVRPLLSIDRQRLRQSLRDDQQTFRDDATNQSPHWRRNWIRNELLPLIRTRYPHADAAILRCATLQRSIDSDLGTMAERAIAQSMRLEDPQGTSPRLIVHPVPPPLNSASVIAVALMRAWDRMGWSRGAMTQSHWDQLVGQIRELPDVLPEPSEPPESLQQLPGWEPTDWTENATTSGASEASALSSPSTINLPGGLIARRQRSGNVVVEPLAGD